MQDIVTTPIVETSIETLITDATHQNGMWIDSRSHVLGDGLINIQDPWTPLDEEEHFIFVVDYNFDTQEYNFGMFSIDTFEVVITNIMVNGIDTGIQDFQYHGQYVTQTISNFQAASKNHGAYVSSVTKLINSLRQDSLLTAAQRSTILDIVTKKTH